MAMDHTQELLTITMEECGEVIQAAAKVMRFGISHENLHRLEVEVGDLLQMFELMHEYDLISWSNVELASDAKRQKLKRYSKLIDADGDAFNYNEPEQLELRLV